MPKTTKAEEFAKAEKQEATIKVKTIFKTLGIVVLLIVAYIGGWTMRSDFANEVKGEVRTQMSVIKEIDQVKE